MKSEHIYMYTLNTTRYNITTNSAYHKIAKRLMKMNQNDISWKVNFIVFLSNDSFVIFPFFFFFNIHWNLNLNLIEFK